MKTYRSALSPVLATVVGISWAGLIWMNILSGDMAALVILFVIALFFLYLYLSTTYAIDGDTLHVRSGFILQERLDIREIRSISFVHDFLAAPAFAFDRLVIRRGKGRSVAISPRNRSSFLNDLLNINPSIVLEGTETA
jgi:Bacterial PH domain